MAKGITFDTKQLWRFLRADKGWWSVLRLTGHWAPTFSLREIEEHLVTLHKGGFIESMETARMGTVYAVTAACAVLPGTETKLPEPAPAAPATEPAVVQPARPNLMGTTYTPAPTTYRRGAFDHTRCPSLVGEQRTAWKAKA